MKTTIELDEFTKGYLVAALWTSEPDDEATSGDFKQKGLGTIHNIKQHWLEQAIADCARFQSENSTLLEQAGDDSQNGHDFWLTRNGHGAGFWDRGYGDVGDALTVAAHAFGEVDFDWECDLEPETE